MPSVGELKKKLQAAGCVASGDKPTLEWRLGLFEKCRDRRIFTADGHNPVVLKGGALKQAAVRCGIYPDQSADELITALTQHLEENGGGNGGGGSGGGGGGSADDGDVDGGDDAGGGGGGGGAAASSGRIDPIRVAKLVLELDGYDDYEGILNIATPPGAARITRETATATMRKAYLKLSLLLHPDKLKWAQATKAFQARPVAALARDATSSSPSLSFFCVAVILRRRCSCWWRCRCCCRCCCRTPFHFDDDDENADAAMLSPWR
jgi:hypothetical protein